MLDINTSVFVFIDHGLMQKIFPHHNYVIICQQLSIYISKFEFQDNFTGPLGMYYIIKSLIVWSEYNCVRCPLEDIYFMWTFYFLFLLLTAVRTFPRR